MEMNMKRHVGRTRFIFAAGILIAVVGVQLILESVDKLLAATESPFVAKTTIAPIACDAFGCLPLSDFAVDIGTLFRMSH
jgi:hypothetical protein